MTTNLGQLLQAVDVLDEQARLARGPNWNEQVLAHQPLQFAMNTFCQRLLNRLAPVGWEDEAGFHYGPERGSLNPLRISR